MGGIDPSPRERPVPPKPQWRWEGASLFGLSGDEPRRLRWPRWLFGRIG